MSACADCNATTSGRGRRCRPCAMRKVAQTENYQNRTRRYGKTFTQAQIDRIRRLCDQYGSTTAAEIAKTSTAAISRLKKRGWVAANRHAPTRARPTDFAIQCDGMTIHQLMKHYNAGTNTVLKWCHEVGRKPMKGCRPRVVLPTDFLLQTRTIGLKAAAEKFGVHPDTLRRRVRQQERAETAKLVRKAGWVDHYAASMSA